MKMRCAEQSADWGPRERDEVAIFEVDVVFAGV